RLHDGFGDRLVAGVPALFEDGIVHEFVAGSGLLLTRTKAGLGIAARLTTAVIGAGATVPRARRLDGPEQADQSEQQRRSQAHPHDLASLVQAPTGAALQVWHP